MTKSAMLPQSRSELQHYAMIVKDTYQLSPNFGRLYELPLGGFMERVDLILTRFQRPSFLDGARSIYGHETEWGTQEKLGSRFRADCEIMLERLRTLRGRAERDAGAGDFCPIEAFHRAKRLGEGVLSSTGLAKAVQDPDTGLPMGQAVNSLEINIGAAVLRGIAAQEVAEYVPIPVRPAERPRLTLRKPPGT